MGLDGTRIAPVAGRVCIREYGMGACGVRGAGGKNGGGRIMGKGIQSWERGHK